MKNNTTTMAVVILFVGLSIAYQIGANKTLTKTVLQNTQGAHMMPDGTMMGGSESMSMADMMESMNAELRGKTGDAFDQAFLAEMIIHHQGAVEMALLAQMNAKHQEIRDLASEIISAQEREIRDMKTWQKSWYNQ